MMRSNGEENLRGYIKYKASGCDAVEHVYDIPIFMFDCNHN